MLHIDEGSIHSLLDGALSADEAARVEAHVAECPECAAAVAEARGFIAASSRILTALDHVPRGVVPAAPPVKWHNRAAWRAAAAVIVVAVGSLVVVRNSEQSKVAAPTMSDSIRTSAAMMQPQTTAASPAVTATSKVQAPPPATPPKQSTTVSDLASSGEQAPQADFSAKPFRGAAPSNVATRARARDEVVDGAIGGNAAAARQVAGAVVAAPQSAVSSRASGVTTMDTAASEQPPLKVVGKPRMIGAKVTLYEVAPGDTVTLTESMNLRLEAVVVTGASSAEPQVRRSAAKSAATAPTQVAAPSPPAPPLQVEVTNGVTAISWPDVTTGNMLKLSGRMPVERLQEFKRRIERDRAAPAKKSP